MPDLVINGPPAGNIAAAMLIVHGDVNPDDASLSAWLVDSGGGRTDGVPCAPPIGVTSEWAFDLTFTTLRGPCTLTVEAVDQYANPPSTVRESRDYYVT